MGRFKFVIGRLRLGMSNMGTIIPIRNTVDVLDLSVLNVGDG